VSQMFGCCEEMKCLHSVEELHHFSNTLIIIGLVAPKSIWTLKGVVQNFGHRASFPS